MDVRVTVLRVCKYGSDDLWGFKGRTSSRRQIIRPPNDGSLLLVDELGASIDVET